MSNKKEKTSVLFVCMGNICRSPTAEGVFRHHVAEAGLSEHFEIDSAGTHAYHVGEPPDRRSQAVAETRGISLDGIRSRRVEDGDFEEFDYILAMDEENQRRLVERAPIGYQSKIRLFLSYADFAEKEVPDPYYGGAAGFEHVLDLIETASGAMLTAIAPTSSNP